MPELNLKESIFSLPGNIFNGLKEIFSDITEAVTWGKSGRQSVLTLEDIHNWFYSVPPKKSKKIGYGALVKFRPVGSSDLRIYQGIFDDKGKCISARQLVISELSEDLIKEFGGYDLVIFSEDTNNFLKTR